MVDVYVIIGVPRWLHHRKMGVKHKEAAIKRDSGKEAASCARGAQAGPGGPRQPARWSRARWGGPWARKFPGAASVMAGEGAGRCPVGRPGLLRRGSVHAEAAGLPGRWWRAEAARLPARGGAPGRPARHAEAARLPAHGGSAGSRPGRSCQAGGGAVLARTTRVGSTARRRGPLPRRSICSSSRVTQCLPPHRSPGGPWSVGARRTVPRARRRSRPR